MSGDLAACAVQNHTLRQAAALLMYQAGTSEGFSYQGRAEDLMADIVLHPSTRYTMYLLAAAATHPFLGGDAVAFREVADAKHALDMVQTAFAGQEDLYDAEVVSRLFDRSDATVCLHLRGTQRLLATMPTSVS